MKDDENELKNIMQQLKQFESSVLKNIGHTIKRNLEERWIDGIDSDTERPFKDLKESTIKSRKSMDKKGVLSSMTTPETSNQIATGKTYKQLNFKIHKNSSVEIGVIGKRVKLLEYNQKNGRTAVALTDDDKKDIDNIVDRAWEKVVR